MPWRATSLLRETGGPVDNTIIETRRLGLRPFDIADAPALFRLASNPAVTRFTTWDAHRTVDDSLTFIRDHALPPYLEGSPGPVAIELRDSRELIGAVGGRWGTRENRCIDFGYWLGEPFWDRGFATEAAQVFLSHLFTAYPVERVQAHYIEGNTASGRVLEKIGMRFEGIRRRALYQRDRFWDLYCYAVLRDEWSVD
jgi:[ribosomal protein S5]-alanine N-acetyltransferase